jgi:hypothetical protein
MLAGLATTAAAVVAIAGGALVVGQSAFDSSVPGMTAEDAGGRENPEAQPAPTFAVPGVDSAKDAPVLLVSGTDYQLGTLADLAAVPMATTQTSRAAGEAPPDTMAGPLGELSDQDGLQSCLNAIMATYPGTVTVVDFARFEGQPAVVVVLRDVQGSTVVAAGAECGQSGADELASVRIQ